MTSTIRVYRFATVLLLVGLLSLLVIISMTLWLGERAQAYQNEATAAGEISVAAVELRYAVQTAESSQRGYLVSDNQIYLAPYSTAKSLAERQLQQLRRLLNPTEGSQPALDRLASIVAEKAADMDQTIALKRDRRDAEALAAFRTNRGKALMDEANVFLSGMVRAADDRLTRGAAEQRQNAALLRLVTICGGVLIVGVVCTVIFVVVRYTRELANATEQVAALNSSLERRVLERTADLAAANDEIQRFAYVVTHDLRAPLVNIMGFTSELEGGIDSLKALIEKRAPAGDSNDPLARQAHVAASVDLPEAIGFIRSSTKKMDNLINAILKLSREGRRQLRPERVEVDDVIRVSAAAVRHQLTAGGGAIELRLDVPPIMSDRTSLEQIFGNLLDNAVKYRAKDRALRIEVRASTLPGERIAVEVADNGRGIADQDRERVFELFRRSGLQDQPGEGIGLAHVQTLVRNLGGHITLAPTSGVGTTFRIVLPTGLPVNESAAA